MPVGSMTALPRNAEQETAGRLAALRTLAVAFIGLLAGQMPGHAQDLIGDLFKQEQRANARGSLAVLSFVGIPDDSAGALFLQSGQSDREFDFRSAQFGGGFRVSEDFPLYLEGYLGWARFDPVLFFSSSGERSELPLKWTSVAATGGIGWEFDLGQHWVFRPMAHLSIGRTQSDASVGAQIVAEILELDADFLDSGGIWAGGLGGSATLAFDRRFASGRQLEMRLRYTHIEYRPIGDDEDLLISSTASNGVFWTRYRFPLGWKAFGRPVRGVTDFSMSYLSGDQAEVLGTDWLGRIGAGIEFDVEETSLPLISAARFMVRLYGSDTVRGASAGIGVSF